jgi:hypothetical protein
MKKTAALFAALLVFAASASAQTWTGPNLERRPSLWGQGDIDFVLSELCFPFIFQNADSTELVRQRRLPTGFGDRSWAGGQPFYLVGQADVWVSFRTTPEIRSCSVSISSGDVARYRAAIEARLTTSPAPFTLQQVPAPLGNFTERLSYCGPPEAPHYMALISLQGRPPTRGTALVMTLAVVPARDPRCDAALAPENGNAPSP